MKYNKLSILSFVLFLLAFGVVIISPSALLSVGESTKLFIPLIFALGLVLPGISLVCGIIAFNQIKRTVEKGKVLAVIAIVIPIYLLLSHIFTFFFLYTSFEHIFSTRS